jgi:hypothetical protein
MNKTLLRTIAGIVGVGSAFALGSLASSEPAHALRIPCCIWNQPPRTIPSWYFVTTTTSPIPTTTTTTAP